MLPRIGMPCLSFCWELVTPPCWQARSYGAGLLAGDPGPAPSWPFGSLGVPELHWPGRQPAPRTASDETLHRLDETLASTSSEELTFAEWFTRWDSGSTPLRHRPPGTQRCRLRAQVSVHPDSRGPQGTARLSEDPSAIRADPLALDTGLVITSQAEAARSDQAITGRERSARLSSGALIAPTGSRPRPAGGARSLPVTLPPAARPSPCERSPAGQPGDSPARAGRATQVASSSAMSDSGLVAGWTVALLVALGLSWLRGPSPRWAILLPIATIFLAVLLHLWQSRRPRHLQCGPLCRGDDQPAVSAGKSTDRAASSVGARSLIRSGMTSGVLPFRLPVRADSAAAGGIPVPADRAVARRDGEQPIPVLIPYEGTYQPGQVPEHVILRESDHQRLRELAQPRLPADKESLFLTGAIHHVAWSGDQEVSLVSDLELRSTAGVASTWRVPINGAHDITATLDGPRGPGVHRGRRTAGGNHYSGSRHTSGSRFGGPCQWQRHHRAESLDFPVNPMPSARLILDRPSRPRPPRLLNARGKLTAAADRSLAAELGPVDHVEIRWGEADAAGSQVAGSIDREHGALGYRTCRRPPSRPVHVSGTAGGSRP